MRENYQKHGMSRDPVYKIWLNIKDRCSNPNNPYFHNYGGRGIAIAAEWMHDFPAFAAELGPRPDGYTVERIKNDLGYIPGNIQWVSRKDQARNMRKNIVLEFGGKKQVLAAWAEDLGLAPSTLWYRIFTVGLSVEKALSLPAQQGVRL
jgi:hypothetical protein